MMGKIASAFTILPALRALVLVIALALLLRRQVAREQHEGERWAVAGAICWFLAEAVVLAWGGREAMLVAEICRLAGIGALFVFVLRAFRPLRKIARSRRRRRLYALTSDLTSDYASFLLALEGFLEEISEPVLLYDAQGRLVWANQVAGEWFGMPLRGSGIEELAAHASTPEERRVWLDAFTRARRDHVRQLVPRTSLRQPDGAERSVELVVTPFDSHLAVLLRDIHWWLELEERYRLLVDEDPLTGLLNRRGLLRAAERELARAKRHGRPLGLIVLDLDHFKSVNDRFGHDVGDEVLREFARRLRATARASDVVARYGGEEFVVLLPETDLERAKRAVGRLLAAVSSRPFTTHAGNLVLTASAGVAVYPAHGRDWAHLFRAADQALYLAKAAGRNRWRLAGSEEAGRLDESQRGFGPAGQGRGP